MFCRIWPAYQGSFVELTVPTMRMAVSFADFQAHGKTDRTTQNTSYSFFATLLFQDGFQQCNFVFRLWKNQPVWPHSNPWNLPKHSCPSLIYMEPKLLQACVFFSFEITLLYDNFHRILFAAKLVGLVDLFFVNRFTVDLQVRSVYASLCRRDKSDASVREPSPAVCHRFAPVVADLTCMMRYIVDIVAKDGREWHLRLCQDNRFASESLWAKKTFGFPKLFFPWKWFSRDFPCIFKYMMSVTKRLWLQCWISQDSSNPSLEVLFNPCELGNQKEGCLEGNQEVDHTCQMISQKHGCSFGVQASIAQATLLLEVCGLSRRCPYMDVCAVPSIAKRLLETALLRGLHVDHKLCQGLGETSCEFAKEQDNWMCKEWTQNLKTVTKLILEVSGGQPR